MYKVCSILTPEERLGAIQLGIIRRFSAAGVGPGEAAVLMKQAAIGSRAPDPDSFVTAVLKLGLGLGIPLGTLDYALRSSLRPRKSRNRKLRAGLDQYNDIVAQYKKQIQKAMEDKEGFQGSPDSSDSLGVLKFAETSPQPSQKSWSTAHPILAAGGAGMLTGATLAAISGLIADHIEAKRQKRLDKERYSDKVSPNTIVFHVRRSPAEFGKSAETDSTSAQAEPVASVAGPAVRIEPAISAKDIKYSEFGQPRETSGKYTSRSLGKSAQFSARGMWNEGVGTALFVAGVPLGYKIVGALHQKLEENRLKSQIAAAQQEYVSLLDGTYADGEKKAEAEDFARMVGLDLSVFSSLKKDAAADHSSPGHQSWVSRNILDPLGINYLGRNVQHFGGATIATGILAAIASEYITRRLLQQKFDKANEEDEDEPEKVTRVLFKNGSSEREISAADALFTISVLQDGLRDGQAYMPLSKLAQVVQGAEKPVYDWGWLDEMGRSPEGRQLMLDLYAQHRGWGPVVDKRRMADGVLQYAGAKDAWKTSAKALRDPKTRAALMPEVRARMQKIMQSDPDAWFSLVGDEKNRHIVNAGINSYASRGILGWLTGLPWIGDYIRKWINSYANTEFGQRHAGRAILRRMGLGDETVNKMSDRYRYQKGGGWGLRPDAPPMVTMAPPVSTSNQSMTGHLPVNQGQIATVAGDHTQGADWGTPMVKTR